MVPGSDIIIKSRKHNNNNTKRRQCCNLRSSILSMTIMTVVYILCFDYFVAIKNSPAESSVFISHSNNNYLSYNNKNKSTSYYDKSFLLPKTTRRRRGSSIIDTTEGKGKEKRRNHQQTNNDSDINYIIKNNRNDVTTTLNFPDASVKKEIMNNPTVVISTSSVVESLPISNLNATFESNNSTTTTSSIIKNASSSFIPRLPIIPKPDPFPKKDDIIKWMQNETNRTAGQILLDFAIIGFAKCGTSTMMVWLDQHKEIFIPQKEINILKKKDPWVLANRLYERSPEDYGRYAVHDQHININSNRSDENINTTVSSKAATDITNITTTPMIRFRAYKSPNDIDDMKAINMLREYFPATKLIVGIRHPILMIESFYNHRVQNGFPIASFMTIGWSNPPKSYGVNYQRAAYHSSLVGLGKTNLNTTSELELLPVKQQHKLYNKQTKSYYQLPKSPNPVFLYEVGQLLKGDGRDLFIEGLENFLGLDEKSLPPPIQIKPGTTNLNVTEQAKRNKLKLDICSKRYTHHRNKLLEIGENVSKWILNYFLKSSDVYVANIDQFRALLSTYNTDPCDMREKQQEQKI